MKLKDAFVGILNEEEKSLKLFYNVDIFIQGFPGDTDEKNEDTLEEDIFKFKSEGVESIPMQDAENIQTLEDLIDAVSYQRILQQHTSPSKQVFLIFWTNSRPSIWALYFELIGSLSEVLQGLVD